MSSNDNLDRLARLSKVTSRSRMGSDSMWIRTASAFVVAAVTSFGALAMFQIYAIRDQVGSLTAEVDRVASVDELVERVVTLEVKGNQTPHAQLSSAKSQFPDENGWAIEMEHVDSIHGISFDPKRSATSVRIVEDGDYFVIAAAQVQRAEEYNKFACFDMWLRLSGDDLRNSSVRHCWGDDTSWEKTTVLVLQTMLILEDGDKLEIMMRSLPEHTAGAVAIEPEMIPLIPAIITTVLKVN